MDIAAIKSGIITNVYHITASKKVPLHQHPKHDEIFYCIGGRGYGVLADGEAPLEAGQTFIVRAGTMHTVRSDGELFVASFMVPVAETAG